MVPLLLASAALLLLRTVPAAGGGSRYCGSDTPLDTPYFAPFQQTAVEAVGCAVAATPLTAGSAYRAHVLRLEEAPDEVNLHIHGRKCPPRQVTVSQNLYQNFLGMVVYLNYVLTFYCCFFIFFTGQKLFSERVRSEVFCIDLFLFMKNVLQVKRMVAGSSWVCSWTLTGQSPGVWPPYPRLPTCRRPS